MKKRLSFKEKEKEIDFQILINVIITENKMCLE